MYRRADRYAPHTILRAENYFKGSQRAVQEPCIEDVLADDAARVGVEVRTNSDLGLFCLHLTAG